MTFRVIARNASALLSANAASSAVGFAVTILLVRYLGVEGTGQYTYAVTYAGLFGILSHLGLYLVLTRQVASAPAEAGRRLGAVLRTQALLSPLVLIVAVGSALVLHPPSETVLIAIAVTGVIVGWVGQSYGAVVTGHEKIHLNAAVTVAMALLWAAFGASLVVFRFGVLVLVVLFTLHKIANAVALRAICRRACGVVPAYDGGSLRGLLGAAVPFGLLILLNDVHWNIGTILLGRLGSTADVGTFAAAYRVIALAVAAVGTVSGVLYPRLSALFETDRGGFAALVRRARTWSLAIGLPLALATTVFADRIVAELFGAGFAGAARSLEVLAWFIPLFCVYSPLSSGLLASGAEVPWLVALALGTGIVVVGSLGLMPALGHVGVAWALVGSGVFLVAAVGRIFWARGLSLPFAASDLKILGALAAMAPVLWQLRTMPVLCLLASFVTYGTVLHLTGFLTEDERRALGRTFAARTLASRLSRGKVDGRYQGL